MLQSLICLSPRASLANKSVADPEPTAVLFAISTRQSMARSMQYDDSRTPTVAIYPLSPLKPGRQASSTGTCCAGPGRDHAQSLNATTCVRESLPAVSHGSSVREANANDTVVRSGLTRFLGSVVALTWPLFFPTPISICTANGHFGVGIVTHHLLAAEVIPCLPALRYAVICDTTGRSRSTT
jgi:hypothetical protein